MQLFLDSIFKQAKKEQSCCSFANEPTPGTYYIVKDLKQRHSILDVIKQFRELRVSLKGEQEHCEDLLRRAGKGGNWEIAIRKGDGRHFYKIIIANTSESKPISPESPSGVSNKLKAVPVGSELLLDESDKKSIPHEYYLLELFKAHQATVEEIALQRQKSFCEKVLPKISTFLEKFVTNFPLKEELLWQLITSSFPFHKQSHLVLLCYLSTLLMMTLDFPDQMVRIISLILSKFVLFDNSLNEPFDRLGNNLVQQLNVTSLFPIGGLSLS